MTSYDTRFRQLVSAAFVAGAFFAVAPAAHANLISNGSFESPTVPASSLTCGVAFNTDCQGYYSPDQPGYPGDPSDTIDGWKVIGKGGSSGTAVILQQGKGYTEPDFGSGQTLFFHAQSGDQSLDLTGEGNQGANGVKQSISSIVGDLYRIVFYVGHQFSEAPGYGGPDSSIDFYINGLLVDTYTNGDDTSEDINWKRFAYTFSADDILTTFAFISSTPFGNNYAGLDNVVVREAVPEPASLPLLAAGVMMFVVMRRRRSPR